MNTKDKKIKELIGIMAITEPMMELTMKATGCDGQYAEKAPLDYGTMVNIYKEATEDFLFKAISEIIEDEELLDEIIAMHKSKAHIAFDNMTEQIAKRGNPFIVAARMAGDSRIPDSFMEFIKNKMRKERKSTDSMIEELGHGINRIKVGSPEELKDIVETLKKIGGGNIELPPGLEEMLENTGSNNSPVEDLEASLKKLNNLMGVDSEECDCDECDADDCANRDKPPKGNQLN